MSIFPSITHYTVQTKHSRVSYATEVAPDIVQMLRPIVRADGGPLMSTGLHLAVSRLEGGAGFALHNGRGAYYVDCTLAWEPDTAALLWAKILLDPTTPKTASQPAFPWLCVQFLPGLATAPPATVDILGDAERCIAWAILAEVEAACAT